jgi:polyisoprenoid-binding protein YceI
MKTTYRSFASSVLGTFGMALALLSVHAADTVRYNSVPNGSKLRMDGTSTIHDWYAESAVVGGFLEADAGFPESAKGPVQPKVEVNIPVRQLKTSGGKRMDAVMQEHMKALEHKSIQYKVIELVPKGAANGGTVNFEAKGASTISGVTRTNSMPVTVAKVGDKQIKVTGTTPLKMTDFGIKPPAPDIGLGLIKTGDDVKLKFEWVAEKAQ